MKNIVRVLLATVVASAVLVGAAPGSEAPITGGSSPIVADSSLTLSRAGEGLAALLASDAVTRIDFQATSWEGAMALIRLAASTCLASAGEVPADSGQAGQADLAALTIRELETSRIWKTAVVELTRETFVVDSRETATKTGEFLGGIMAIVTRVTDGHQGLTSRQAARRALDEIVVDTESGVPLLDQCLSAVRELAGLSNESLDRRLMISDR